MTDKQIIIDGVDVAKCRCFTSEWDFNNCGHICKGTECKYKRLWYKKQLQAKEQECEELKEELHQNFKEKDRLHLIIDRLLEASGYDTNTASAEDFEDVYENMRYEKQQLYQLKQTLIEIKEIAEGMHDLWINKTPYTDMDNLVKHLLECELNRIRYKLDEISESEVKNES